LVWGAAHRVDDIHIRVNKNFIWFPLILRGDESPRYNAMKMIVNDLNHRTFAGLNGFVVELLLDRIDIRLQTLTKQSDI
jgi:hypothetical protein